MRRVIEAVNRRDLEVVDVCGISTRHDPAGHAHTSTTPPGTTSLVRTPTQRRDGKIARHDIYEDRGDALKAVGLEK